MYGIADVTRIIANVTELISMLPFMNENSFFSLARTGNRISLIRTAVIYQINHLCTRSYRHVMGYFVWGLSIFHITSFLARMDVFSLTLTKKGKNQIESKKSSHLAIEVLDLILK